MPSVNSIKKKDFVKFLKYIGCSYSRTRGSHMVYKKSGLLRPIVFSNDRELASLHIKTNLKTLGYTWEAFLEILRIYKFKPLLPIAFQYLIGLLLLSFNTKH